MRLLSILSCILLLSVVTSSGLRAEDVAAAETTVKVFGDASLTVPPAFKPVAVRSSIIEHEFKVPGEADDVARLTMMPSSGGVQPNIDRWKGQFIGGKAEDQKVEQFKLGDWTVHLVELSGTFNDSMGGPFSGKTIQRPNYGMLGAILENPQSRLYFVKLVGSKENLAKNRAAFIEMAKSLK